MLSSGLRPGDPNHHGSGNAVDISRIDGIGVGDGDRVNPAAARLVQDVQTAANAHPEVRENFGPAGLFKASARGGPKSNYQNGSEKRINLQREHMNHVHLSGQP